MIENQQQDTGIYGLRQDTSRFHDKIIKLQEQILTRNSFDLETKIKQIKYFISSIIPHSAVNTHVIKCGETYQFGPCDDENVCKICVIAGSCIISQNGNKRRISIDSLSNNGTDLSNNEEVINLDPDHKTTIKCDNSYCVFTTIEKNNNYEEKKTEIPTKKTTPYK